MNANIGRESYHNYRSTEKCLQGKKEKAKAFNYVREGERHLNINYVRQEAGAEAFLILTKGNIIHTLYSSKVLLLLLT